MTCFNEGLHCFGWHTQLSTSEMKYTCLYFLAGTYFPSQRGQEAELA